MAATKATPEIVAAFERAKENGELVWFGRTSLSVPDDEDIGWVRSGKIAAGYCDHCGRLFARNTKRGCRFCNELCESRFYAAQKRNK